MQNLTLDQIVKNLSQVDYDFAFSLIQSNFKGNQKTLLLDFLNNEISQESLKYKWGQINVTGNILEDIKIVELTLIDRLKLLQIILNTLELNNGFVDTYKKALNSKEDCAKALAFLVADILKKDKYGVRNKEGFIQLLEALRKDKEDKVLEEPDNLGLLPHKPTILNTLEAEVVEELEIQEEEEVTDLELLNI